MQGDASIGKAMFDKYMMAYNDVIGEIEKLTGKKPAPYKELEEGVLLAFFESLEAKKGLNGLDFTMELLSGLIVDQALPNANHRTALYFVDCLLRYQGFKVDMITNSEAIRQYFLDSKHILKKAKKDYRKRHYDRTKELITKILGSSQSGKLGNISAYSFMTSFMTSSKDLLGLTDSSMKDNK